jgi:hypothetical protein
VVDRKQIQEGMVVRSSDGKRLGRVLGCDERGFVVEKGFFFATEYVATYGDVADVAGDEIRLSLPEERLEHHARALPREGGFGETFTLATAGRGDLDPLEVRARTEEEEDVRPRRDGDDGEQGARAYRFGSGEEPACYGDEGGGGLL